ncbi:MAG: preprotein translocase subunit YajC [Acidimicrobiales bacterium]|nr:preprotein translocase subunit YajC [Acidimicrobiales bacterium]
MEFLPLILIGAFFYLALIRPQQKKASQQRSMLAALEEGDEVVTVAGIYGMIIELEDDAVWLDVAEGVELKMSRAAIQTVLTRDGESVEAPADEFPGQRLLQKGKRKADNADEAAADETGDA